MAEAIKLRRPTAGIKSTFAGLLHQFLLLHQPAKVLLKRPCRCNRQRRPRQRIAIGEKADDIVDDPRLQRGMCASSRWMELQTMIWSSGWQVGAAAPFRMQHREPRSPRMT